MDLVWHTFMLNDVVDAFLPPFNGILFSFCFWIKGDDLDDIAKFSNTLEHEHIHRPDTH